MGRTNEPLLQWPRPGVVECRSSTRYPLTLELRFAAAGGSGTAGSGRTIDVSSSGLSFTCDRPLAPGQQLDVAIDWPVPLNGGVQLQLVLSGEVVRAKGSVAALRIRRHEFRTRSLGPKAVPPRSLPR